MLRLTTLKNVNQKRTLHARLAQTQATPVPMVLHSGFDRAAGALSGGTAITGAKAAILPGLVAVKRAGRAVTVAGAVDTERAMGLFGNFVGGQMDEIGDSADVSVWSGPGSHWQVLAPAFDDTGLSAAATAEDGSDEQEVYLKSNAKGQLTLRDQTAQTGEAPGDVARLIERQSSKAIVIQLLV